MLLKLEKEQIEEIIENYGGTERLIKELGRRIEKLDILKDESEIYEMVVLCVSRIETLKLKADENHKKVHYSMNDVIKYELIRKFQDMGVEEIVLGDEEVDVEEFYYSK